MAEVADDEADNKRHLTLETPRSLASIGYSSLLSSAYGASSEDEAPEEQAIPSEDFQTAIGVSISSEQTRLSSPRTPAVEKAGAIESAGGFFGPNNIIHDALHEDSEAPEALEDVEAFHVHGADEGKEHKPADLPYPVQSDVPVRSPCRTDIRLPSPWRSDTQRQAGRKPGSSLLDGLFNRRRAASGPESTLEGWQRSLLSNLPSLPSMPRSFSIASAFGTSHNVQVDDRQEDRRKSRRSSVQVPYPGDSSNSSASTAIARQRSQSDGLVPESSQRFPSRVGVDNTGGLPRKASLHSEHSRAGLLRRSTSDHSLLTQRTLSLGDDSRFEDVQDQVNSRFKAIRDSLQDSNIRLPRIANLSVSSLTPDFLRERSAIPTEGQGLKQTPGDADRVGRGWSAKSTRPVDPMTRQPYTSAKAAASDVTKPAPHPHFNRALQQLEGDVIVLGGYRGSTLRSAEPPHRQVWVPVKVGLNLRKVNLELGLEEGDDERASDSIIADGMLSHIGPVDIGRRLLKRLRGCQNARAGALRIHDYGCKLPETAYHYACGAI